MAEPVTIRLPDGGQLAGLVDAPAHPAMVFVFAHGAGAGMRHPFMQAMAEGLAQQGIATLRFQFPFMDQGSHRPDTPAVAEVAVRSVVQEAGRRFAGLPIFAGGKSYGGRMTTQAQATQPLPNVRGVILVGFPLHAANKPATTRAKHLAGVRVPMLFLQGTRDALADLHLMRETVESLAPRATLRVLEGADHAFHVLVRSGRTDMAVREEMLGMMAGWMRQHSGEA